MPNFEVVSGSLIVSDPCYDTDEILNLEIPAKNGIWVAHADIGELNVWGKRVFGLTAEYTGVSKKVRSRTSDISVDSGQAGIFDSSNYKNKKISKNVERLCETTICENDPWYSLCCDRTLHKDMWGTIPYGVVSSSGLGDGHYEVVYYVNNKNLAVRVEIIFISENDTK